MTRKVFWEDPYQTELDTTVSSVTDDQVTVSATIFYAFSGGQESDAGTIAGLPVLAARRDGAEIFYILPEDHGLRSGEAVHMRIDWERRYRLMRLHFAAELVLELVSRELAGVERLGAHIAADKARLDFRWPENVSALFPTITDRAQALIDADLAIVSAFSDPANERRFWEVPGFARVPCGGTHLQRTGEIGRITLKRRNVGRGKERIEICAATAAC
jgi:Ser-tRNA(Ala) deacylase AlaX